MKVRLLVIFFLLPFGLYAQESQEFTNYIFGIHFGVNYTKYKNDSIDYSATALPLMGFSVTKRVFPKVNLQPALEISMRGSNSISPSIKDRNSFLSFQLLGQYEITEGLKLELGGRYNYLLDSYYFVKDDSLNFYGISKIPNDYYKSSVELVAGLELDLTQQISVRARYSNDFQSTNYNFLFSLNIKLNDLKFKAHYKKYTSLETALSEPLSVKKLVLHRQKLDSLPKEIGQMLNLEVLILDGNNIKKLPEEIGTLVNLEKLSVSFNNLESLPTELGNLEHLKELNLHHNNIKALPESLFDLKRLNFLYIGKNSLTEISPKIGNLTSLIELDVASSGPALQIPSEIKNLHGLETIYYDNNITLPDMIISTNSRLRLVEKK